MMTNSDAQRLRTLEKDNKELKQMVADLLLEKRVLKIALEKTLSPRALRELLPAGCSGSTGTRHGTRPDLGGRCRRSSGPAWPSSTVMPA